MFALQRLFLFTLFFSVCISHGEDVENNLVQKWTINCEVKFITFLPFLTIYIQFLYLTTDFRAECDA